MIRTVVREPLFWLLTLVYFAWLSCSVAYGQSGRGVFIRQSCASVANPVENETYCFHSGPTSGLFTQGDLYLYIGNAKWSCKTCGGLDDQTIQEVLTQGRVAFNLNGFINRAQLGDAIDRGVAVYSDGVESPARMSCVVAGVEDNCDKGFGLNSGYKFFIKDSDGDDAVSYTADSGTVVMQERSGNPFTPATGYWGYYFKSDGLYYIDDAGTVTGPLGTGGGSTDISAHVFHNAAQTISNATDTVLAFNSERNDTHTLHDNATNNSRITISAGAGAGKYLIGVNVRFQPNADSNLRSVYLFLNNTTIIAQSRTPAVNDASLSTVLPPLVVQYDLAVGDFVEVYVHQQSGGNLDVQSNGNYSPEFWIQKLAS